MEAKAQVAVIGESMAKRLFAATEGVEGRHFAFNGRDYRVCGVVRDVSNATPETAGDLWLPLLNAQYISKELDRQGLLGNVFVSLLVDDAENFETVRNEVQDVFRRYTLQDKDYEYDVMGQPDPYWLSTFRGSPILTGSAHSAKMWIKHPIPWNWPRASSISCWPCSSSLP